MSIDANEIPDMPDDVPDEVDEIDFPDGVPDELEDTDYPEWVADETDFVCESCGAGISWFNVSMNGLNHAATIFRSVTTVTT